jgi:hypothetical protein
MLLDVLVPQDLQGDVLSGEARGSGRPRGKIAALQRDPEEEPQGSTLTFMVGTVAPIDASHNR